MKTSKDAKPCYRHEYKYLIDPMQEQVLKMTAAGVLIPDSHADAEGEYVIRSLYFDGIDDHCYYENENGTDPRSKYRIRIYNYSSKRITLECKSKVRGMTHKIGCPITEEQCRRFMDGCIPDADTAISPMQNVMFTRMRLEGLKPAVIVQYLRKPYIYNSGNVRVTFDGSIGSSGEIDGFLEENIPIRQVLPMGKSILEVKWDEYLPKFIKDDLQINELQWTSFSKYYLCRKYNAYGGLRI